MVPNCLGCVIEGTPPGIVVLYSKSYITSVKSVTIQWTGLLDWNTGLDYWTDIFLVFVHSVVGFMGSC